MPPFDASAAQTLPDLGRVLVSWLEHADLCEVLRKRAQVVVLRAQVALPRRATSDTASRWLSGTHVLCEFVSRKRFGARAFFLALPADQAAGLLDRVLGGSGRTGVAGATGALSDTECGVLAHLAAQACAACSEALAVRDVFCADAERSRALCADGAIWPLRIAASPARDVARTDPQAPRGQMREEAGDLVLDVKLLFGAAADCPAGRYPLAISLTEDVAPETLAALEVGDLLASDAWPLTLTARGLEGMVALSVAGVSEHAAAVLCGSHLAGVQAAAARGRNAAPAGLSPGRKTERSANHEALAELRLYELPLSFWQLAELVGGGTLDLPGDGLRQATLHVAGQARASGSLMQLRGAIALRVHLLFTRDSMR
jgi:hypothetical protein